KLDVNLVAADDVGRNALHYAAMNGNLPIMKMLFKTGQFQVNVQDDFGMTPLHLASRSNSEECVRNLIEQGADCMMRDETGRKAFDLSTSKSVRHILQTSFQ
ncbi:hypothetical protein GUITHDRAFT_64779, partial [Guillardia theta CCMP2712]